MDDPIAQMRDWLLRLPPFTKYFLGTVLLLAVLSTMRVVPYDQYHFTLELVFQHLQIWRLFTCFAFIRNLSFSLLVLLYVTHYFLRRIEEQLFGSRQRADFFMLLAFLWTFILALGGLFGVPFLGECFIMALVVIWCHYRKQQVMTLFFGISMESGYFPYVFAGFSVLFGQPLIVTVIGLITAILYIQIKDTIKLYYGIDLLRAPQFLKNRLNSNEPSVNPRVQGRSGVRIGDPQ